MRFEDGMGRGVLREEAKEGGEGGGGAAAPNGADAGKQPEAAVDAKALQSEIDRLKGENSGLKERADQGEQAARYWHEQVKGKKEPEAKTTAKATDAPEEEDLLEVVTKKGAKGVSEYLKKQGFVSADEVESRIENRAQQLTTENQLATEYPDLKDTKSEFFKEVAPRYQALVNAGVPQTVAMRLAAQQAELDGYKSGKRLTAAEKEEREARARAQAPDKKKSNTAAATEEDDTLDDFQKYVCEALEVDPDKYKERAKKGITFRER